MNAQRSIGLAGMLRQKAGQGLGLGLGAMLRTARRGLGVALSMLLALPCMMALAQQNAIESIVANQQGANLIVKISLKQTPATLPIGFSIANPPRIVLDFGATQNATGKNALDMNLGDLRSVNVVQTGERARLVFNLKRILNYATALDGKVVVVTLDGLAAVAAATPTVGRQLLRDIDFRRGANGEGRIVVDLPNGQVAVDARQQGSKVVVDFLKTGLPETLRRRLDVTDFGTPVALIT